MLLSAYAPPSESLRATRAAPQQRALAPVRPSVGHERVDAGGKDASPAPAAAQPRPAAETAPPLPAASGVSRRRRKAVVSPKPALTRRGASPRAAAPAPPLPPHAATDDALVDVIQRGRSCAAARAELAAAASAALANACDTASGGAGALAALAASPAPRGPTDGDVALAVGLPSGAAVRSAEQSARSAASELLRRLMPLVASVASRLVRATRGEAGGVAIEDAVQEGARGALRAAASYSPSKHVKFTTWVYPWVEAAVRRALQNDGRTVRVPVHIHEARAKARKAARASSDQSSPESSREAASAYDAAFGRVASLDTPLPSRRGSGDASFFTLGDTLASSSTGDDALGASSAAAAAAAAADLEGVLSTLLERERVVLSALYGLDAPPGSPQPTAKAVAARLGLSPATVTRAVQSGLAKLRSPERSAFLAPVLPALSLRQVGGGGGGEAGGKNPTG